MVGFETMSHTLATLHEWQLNNHNKPMKRFKENGLLPVYPCVQGITKKIGKAN